MIYITGDTHSDFSRFTEENFQIQSEMTKDDYIYVEILAEYGHLKKRVVEKKKH